MSCNICDIMTNDRYKTHLVILSCNRRHCLMNRKIYIHTYLTLPICIFNLLYLILVFLKQALVLSVGVSRPPHIVEPSWTLNSTLFSLIHSNPEPLVYEDNLQTPIEIRRSIFRFEFSPPPPLSVFLSLTHDNNNNITRNFILLSWKWKRKERGGIDFSITRERAKRDGREGRSLLGI